MKDIKKYIHESLDESKKKKYKKQLDDLLKEDHF